MCRLPSGYLQVVCIHGNKVSCTASRLPSAPCPCDVGVCTLDVNTSRRDGGRSQSKTVHRPPSAERRAISRLCESPLSVRASLQMALSSTTPQLAIHDVPHFRLIPVVMFRSLGWHGAAECCCCWLSASAAPAAEPSCEHGAVLHDDATPSARTHPAYPGNVLGRESRPAVERQCLSGSIYMAV